MTRQRYRVLLAAVALLWLALATPFPAPGAPPPSLRLTPEERQFLVDHPVLSLGLGVEVPPFQDVTITNGQPRYVGLAADYLEVLGHMLEVSFQPRFDLGLNRALDLAQTGGIDLFPCLAVTPDRTAYLHYTRPYTVQPYVLVARNDSPVTGIDDLSGRTMAVAPAYFAYERLSRDHPGLGAHFLFLPSGPAALATVAEGRADATILNLAHVTCLMARHGYHNVRIVTPMPWEQNALAMATPWPVLAGILQKALDAIPPEVRTAMEAQAYRPRANPVSSGLGVRNGLVLIGCALAALSLLAWWLRRIARERQGRLAMQKALQGHQELLEAVFNATDDSIIVLDDAYRVLHCNRVGAERFGLDVASMRGRDMLELIGPPVATGRRERYLEAQGTGCTVHFTDTRLGHTYESSIHPFPNPSSGRPRLAVYARDVTEHRAAETTLRENQERLDKIFRLIPVVVAITSLADGRYLDVNEAFSTISGYSRQELLGCNSAELAFWVHPVDRETIYATVAREGLIRNYELSLHLKDGRLGTALFSGIPLEAYGQPCLLSVIVDITGRKATEEALRLAKNSAEAANRAKSRFLSTMSHEIRTPMNTILGMVDVLRATPLTVRQEEFLRTLETAGEGLMALLTDILELSKIEAGSLEWTLLPFDPAELQRQTLAMLRPQAERKGLVLTGRVAEDVPQEIHGDPTRLRQILVNLLSNAVKFTHQGEIRLDVRRLGGQALRDELLFSVSDTGIGIAPDQQQAIFEPFTQADGGTTRAYGGTGLGLAISALLANGLGGRLWVESRPGAGSTFYCAVPLECRPRCALGSESVTPAEETRPWPTRAWTTSPDTD
jgi:PAS domain S-box-containing protein